MCAVRARFDLDPDEDFGLELEHLRRLRPARIEDRLAADASDPVVVLPTLTPDVITRL